MTHARPTLPHAGGFHAKDGWYFRRGTDASVTVWSEAGCEATFTAATWASVVASVSRHGEGHESFHSALTFHGEAEAA